VSGTKSNTLRWNEPSRPIEVAGKTFWPPDDAAIRAQLNPRTLSKWIAQGETPNRWPLETHQAEDTSGRARRYISEESVQLLENRFQFVVGTHGDSTGCNIPILPYAAKRYHPKHLNTAEAAEGLGITTVTLNTWFRNGVSSSGYRMAYYKDVVLGSRYLSRMEFKRLKKDMAS
jgi:hypothetical protein